MPLKGIAYGASKAALNFVIRKLHHENDGLSACLLIQSCVACILTSYAVAFPICPGGVVTDMCKVCLVFPRMIADARRSSLHYKQ
jgi:hypothetical protein